MVFQWGALGFALFGLRVYTGFLYKDGAFKIAEELRSIVEDQNIQISSDKHIKYTVSIGVDCLNCKIDSTISESLGRADKALYKAKNEGRNQVCF